MWAQWADYDASVHDWDAYTLDIRNETTAIDQANLADRELVACL